MDAWETLLDKSTLGAGHDAWEHLNAQAGGFGEGIVLLDGLEVEMETACVEVEIDSTILEVEVDFTVVDVEVETIEVEVEVCV